MKRPDISYTVNKLIQFLQGPIENHWVACKRVLSYLRGTSTVDLHFIAATRLNLEVYVDANYASSLMIKGLQVA